MEFLKEMEDILSDTDSEISCKLACEISQDEDEGPVEPEIIEPYRFEPYLEENEVSAVEISSSDEGSVDGDTEEVALQNNLGRLQNTEWCSCGFCEPMLTAEESVCCNEQERVVARKSKQPEPPINCITEHDDFQCINLRLGVLETAYYGYRQRYGPIPAGNDWKRYTAYRQFIRWCYFYLGRKIRVPIPSCVVNRVRLAFPADVYRGFQNAPDDVE